MIRLYFELLKSVLIRNVVGKLCVRLDTNRPEVGTDGLKDSEALTEMVTDLQLFAEQYHHTEILNEIMHRLRIVQRAKTWRSLTLNETEYDTEIVSAVELEQVTVGDLELRFNFHWTSWGTVNEVSELMKFLILRWIGRPSNKFVLKNWIQSLVVTVMRISVDQCWMQCHTIHLFAAWSKVIELLPTSEVAYDQETLERLKTAVSEIPEKIPGLDSPTIVAPCPTCNPDYDVNKIWDEKADTNK